MVRVISIQHTGSTPAGFKLTKLFGIYDFSVAKYSGMVLIITSSNQRLGECIRPKMESQVVGNEQGCWQTMPFNMPQMER